MHTPYDGSSKLFQIGLKPLDVSDWIDADDRLAADLAEKERLAATRWDDVFAAEDGTDAAQSEVLALLVEHLPARFPALYRHEDGAMLVAGRRVPLDAAPALWTAARLVQEDLVLMRRGETGWRLAAASLSFPSSWRLADKFRRPIHEVHAPVPGFGDGTRNAELIARMFDNMRPEQPMIRWNWSVYGDAELFHPHNSPERRFGDGARAESVFLRVERQTLRLLPQSPDILFTIRIIVDPLEALERHSDAPRIAASLIDQLMALSTEQVDYKGMTLERDRLVDRLREIAV
jgi:dimethylamine monooxygenase subunit A